MTKKDIAKVAYMVNRAYCESLGDHSFGPWEEAPEWQQKTCLLGVDFHIANPGASPSASHESWLAVKETEGWKYGPQKDPERKEHPCMVPFEQLPGTQQSKDFLFKAVVEALKGFIEP